MQLQHQGARTFLRTTWVQKKELRIQKKSISQPFVRFKYTF